MSKQAVLIIHGIGNQRPMDTLRQFVRTVWSDDASLHRDHRQAAGLWSKPYPLSQNFELRRLTTAENKAGLKTDFFEFYWAHLIQGTKISHLVNWALSVLFRPPSAVPRSLRLLYAVLWLALIVFVALSALAAWRLAAGEAQPWWLKWLLGLIVAPALTMVLTEIVGDAARYLHVAPANIQRRHEIRSAGVQVLQSLHEKGYERIVLVGHSLGTVIAYDILSHSWAEAAAQDAVASAETLAAVRTLEDMAVAGVADPARWQAAQRHLFELRRKAGSSWRVSDFITLGSPLAHAQVLLAADAADLAQRIQARELLACPPALESTSVDLKPWSGFSYPPGAAQRRLHHAAVFAVTRWTNLYFPARALIGGDLVGGPLAPVFGPAVRDVAVSTTRWGGLLSHTAYWQPDGVDSHIAALRQALDLLDRGAAPIP